MMSKYRNLQKSRLLLNCRTKVCHVAETVYSVRIKGDVLISVGMSLDQVPVAMGAGATDSVSDSGVQLSLRKISTGMIV